MAFEIGAPPPSQGGGNYYKKKGNQDEDYAFKTGEKPHDLQTEKALLSTIILSNDVYLDIQNIVKKEDFFLPAHQLIFQSITDLNFKGIPIDLNTLGSHLRDHGRIEVLGGINYLVSITESSANPLHCTEYARIVSDLSWRRRLITAGEMCRGIALKSGETQEIAAEIEKSIFDATQEKKHTELAQIKHVIQDTIKELEKRTDQLGKNDLGVKTGLKDLDESIKGFRPGQLIILAARPGMGKTSLASNILYNAAAKQNKAVLFMSLEMTKEELTERVLSFVSNVDAGKLRTGNLSPDDYNELFYAGEDIEEAPIYIDDRSVVNPFDVLAQARRLISRLNLEKKGIELGLIVVDYIQIMKAGGRHENRSLEVGAITGGLKSIAKELRVPVLALSQLNRESTKRTNESKIPQLSDLKDSGSIEADADVVMFIHREQDPHADSRAPSEAQIVIAKQRSGPTRNVKVTWLGHLTKFADYMPQAAVPANPYIAESFHQDNSFNKNNNDNNKPPPGSVTPFRPPNSDNEF